MVYDAANRITTSLQGTDLTTFTFDANGNRTVENLNGALTTNVFDNENRMIEVLNSDGSHSTHTYAGGFPVDGEGLRRSAHEPGGSLTTFIWDGADYLQERH